MKRALFLTQMLITAVAAHTMQAAQAQPAVSTGAFRNTSALGTELQRGLSTKADVQRLLGVPNGTGAATFPMIKPGVDEIWYYEDIESTDTKVEGGAIRMRIRQQIMLVFFDKGLFDGYMWTTNAGSASAN